MHKVLSLLASLMTFFVGIALVLIPHAFRHPDLRKIDSDVSSPGKTAPSRMDIETEKYAVYSAVIRHMYTHDKTKMVVIERETGCWKAPSGEDAMEAEKLFRATFPQPFLISKGQQLMTSLRRWKNASPLTKDLTYPTDIPSFLELRSKKCLKATLMAGVNSMQDILIHPAV